MEEQVKELKEKIGKLEEKAAKYEAWIKALTIIAAFLGIGGSGLGVTLYSKANDLNQRASDLSTKYTEVKKQADGLDQEMKGKAATILRDVAPQVIKEALTTQLNDFVKRSENLYALSGHSHNLPPIPDIRTTRNSVTINGQKYDVHTIYFCTNKDSSQFATRFDQPCSKVVVNEGLPFNFNEKKVDVLIRSDN